MAQKFKIPEVITEQHDNLLQAMWAEVERILAENRAEIKNHWEREQNTLSKKYDIIFNELESLKEKYNLLVADYNQLDKANQLLEKSIEQRSSDLRASQQQQAELNAKNSKFLDEIKQLTLDLGRITEHRNLLQKQIEKDHLQAQDEQDRLQNVQQALQLQQYHNRQNEQEIQHLEEELAKVSNQLRMETHKATVAETLSTEVQNQKEQAFHEVIQLKGHLKSAQEKTEGLQKNLEEANKRISNLQTQAEMQVSFYQKNIKQLETELKTSKSELHDLRQRVIKAESAAERERKAIERLENKLLTVKQR